MLNRRQFISAAAAGAAMFARGPRAFAARYDLIIRGGRVIDPSVRLDAIRDVAISGGRIVAVEAALAGDAADTIDARGKLVVPGLLDIHTHTARSTEGPGLVLQDGVTGWIDAGSPGADRIGATSDAIAKSRDFIVGVKARLSRDVAGANDYEVLRRAQEVATSFGLPVMIHMWQTISPLPKLIDLLKRGDIVTHMFAPPPNSVIDDSGHILPEVLAARRRGVWFDIGNGQAGHMRWDTIAAIMKAGFWPDTFSTDWNANAHQTGVIDLPNCMSKLFGYGLTLDQTIARATVNAARIFPLFNDRGTLNVGAPADVALLELRKGNFEFLDNYKNKITGRQRLFPSATVLAGKRVPHA